MSHEPINILASERFREDAANLVGQEYQSRIIQYKGKRTNIRLEVVFWNILEEMARRRDVLLRILINDLIAENTQGKNNTAYLRFRAISWVNRMRYTANEKLHLQKSEVRAILNATLMPAFMFSTADNVSRYNKSFKRWLEANTDHNVSDGSLEKIRISFRRSFATVKFKIQENDGCLDREPAAILVPGYVFPVTVNLVALNNHSDDERVYMGIFNLPPEKLGSNGS